MNIYENIMEIANRDGLSLNEIERRANIGHGSISRWKTQDPKVTNLMKVAKALKVRINVLIK